MRVFGPVIEALLLPMLDPGHDLPLGSGVASQLVGDEHTRGSTPLLEELAEQAFGGYTLRHRSGCRTFGSTSVFSSRSPRYTTPTTEARDRQHLVTQNGIAAAPTAERVILLS